MLHIHACCKHMFQMFSGVHTHVCKCFIRMFAYVCNGFQMFLGVSASVSHACFKCFICFFMLQLLHLDVSKVDRVLHMGCTWEAAGGADDVRGSAGPLLVRSLTNLTRYTLVCSLCLVAS
jgi:hypothetical protein